MAQGDNNMAPYNKYGEWEMGEWCPYEDMEDISCGW